MKKHKTILTVIIILILTFSIQFARIENIVSISKSYPKFSFKSNSNVLMDIFPIDLGLLFWDDNLTTQAQRLNGIGNSSGGWMMTPYGGHFISNHVEGAEKFYFYPERHLEVRAPHNGSYIPEIHVGLGTSDNIDGNDVIVDIGIAIDIGNECRISFGHICLLQSIYDDIDSTDAYYFEENELIGYTMESWALDFYYYNATSVLCPYKGFTPELKTQVDSYFNLQYERAKLSGLHPEGRICNELLIEIPGTIWGVWAYDNGSFNSYFDDDTWPANYEVGIHVLLHRSHTTPETFWKNPINHSELLTEDDLGLFGDGNGAELAGYDKIGDSLIMQVEGDDTNGILELRTMGYYDWGPVNTSIYSRYELSVNETNFKKDKLQIEHFSDLSSAQSGFTNNNLTYKRFLHFYPYVNPYVPTETPTPTPSTTEEGIFFGGLLSLSTALSLAIFVIIIVRRKKK